jgi:hypothetical protein
MPEFVGRPRARVARSRRALPRAVALPGPRNRIAPQPAKISPSKKPLFRVDVPDVKMYNGGRGGRPTLVSPGSLRTHKPPFFRRERFCVPNRQSTDFYEKHCTSVDDRASHGRPAHGHPGLAPAAGLSCHHGHCPGAPPKGDCAAQRSSSADTARSPFHSWTQLVVSRKLMYNDPGTCQSMASRKNPCALAFRTRREVSCRPTYRAEAVGLGGFGKKCTRSGPASGRHASRRYPRGKQQIRLCFAAWPRKVAAAGPRACSTHGGPAAWCLRPGCGWGRPAAGPNKNRWLAVYRRTWLA